MRPHCACSRAFFYFIFDACCSLSLFFFSLTFDACVFVVSISGLTIYLIDTREKCELNGGKEKKTHTLH